MGEDKVKTLLAAKGFNIKKVGYSPERNWFVGEAVNASAVKVFVKGSGGATSQEKLSKEWNNLARLHSLLSADLLGSVIKPVEQIVYKGGLINVYKYFEGKPISKLRGKERRLAIDRAVEWITRLALLTIGNQPRENGDFPTSVKKSVLEHGDFTVNNLLWDKNTKNLLVVDWEMMSEKGLPMYDLVDLLISGWLGTLRGKMRIGMNAELSKNGGKFISYLGQIGLEKSMIHPLIETFFKVAAKRESALDGIPVEKTVYSRLYSNVKNIR